MLSLDDAKKLATNNFFFDTNVWFYIHGPYADPSDVCTAKYSDFFASVLKARGRIHINSSVVSEFVNRYVRMIYNIEADDYQKQNNRKLEFKAFRKTVKYRETVVDVSDDLFHILQSVVQIDTPFSAFDVDGTLKKMSKSGVDFNDLVIIDDCVKNQFILVTHDKDFSSCPCRVATANNSMLP